MNKAVIPVLIMATVLAGCRADESVLERHYKVGVMLPLSGPAATYGFNIRRGIELAKKELNANMIELIYRDTACDPEKTPDAVEELDHAGVTVIIGEVCSAATLAAVPVAEANGIVMISPSSTSPELSDVGGRYFFRTVPSDAGQGVYAAGLLKQLGHTKIGILYSNEAYGQGLQTVLAEEFDRMGGESIGESFEVEIDAIEEAIESILAQQPEALYLVTNSPKEAGKLLTSLSRRQFTGLVVGSEAFKDDSILQDVGMAAENMLVTGVRAGNSGFIERYRVEYGLSPGAFVAQGYDAIGVIVAALRTKPDQEALPETIAGVDIEGVSGTITFNETGDIESVYDVYEVVHGVFIKRSDL
jgi:branched-chain amino acid transport system substrate-binding protein